MSVTWTALEFWNGTELVPLALDGVWDGSEIVPATLDGYEAEGGEDYTPPNFTHAAQLTASNVGHLPWGTTLTLHDDDFLADEADAVYEDLHITGQTAIQADNVTFRRCWLEGMVTNAETGHPFELWDCTVGGSEAPAWLLSGPSVEAGVQGAVGRSNFLMVRCLVQDIDEGPRMGVSTEMRDCYIRRLHRPDPADHCDGCQTYGANGGISGGSGITLLRVRFDARFYDDDRDLTGDIGSSCYQCGDAPLDMLVTVQDCYFLGGTYSLRLYDATVAGGLTYVATGNRFVRNSYEFGPVTTANEPGTVTWSGNTYSDNGEEITL